MKKNSIFLLSGLLLTIFNASAQQDTAGRSIKLRMQTAAVNSLPNTFPSTGNVGIGTTSPVSSLDMNGGLTLDNTEWGEATVYTTRSSSDIGRSFYILNSVTNRVAANMKVGGVLISDNFAYAYPAKGDLVVKGKVGIGIANPTEKLAVNGTIRSKEVKVDLVNWPDYVFQKDYDLTSLADVEKFIKINKHLPDIPSAEEVKNEGVSLGEMNAKLLKKIEELTLYVIQLKDEVEKLKVGKGD